MGVTLEQRGARSLLDRTARLMAHRGVPFTIDLSGAQAHHAAWAS